MYPENGIITSKKKKKGKKSKGDFSKFLFDVEKKGLTTLDKPQTNLCS